MNRIPVHRIALASWQVLTLIVLTWMITRPRDGEPFHWIWIPVLLTPVLVFIATLAPIRRNSRAIAYWVLAAVSIPTAAGGIVSLVFPLYLVSIVLLIWAARKENPAEEIVQM